MNYQSRVEVGMSHVRLALALVLTSMFVFGQSERGNISGIISDPQGAAVAGAVIKVINRDTNATANAVASSSGEYNAPNLSPGTYRIEVTRARLQAVRTGERDRRCGFNAA